jgi:hypothetical protein
MKWLPLLLIVSACAFDSHYAKWPLRGAMLSVQNPTAQEQVVIARDGRGREWVVARIKPQARACFRWPFIDNVGLLRTDGGDEISTEPFEPWSADGWEWDLNGQPIANPRVCR